MIQGDLKTFILIIFITIAIIIVLNIVLKSVLIYILFNKLNGSYSTKIIGIVAVVIAIYLLLSFFKSKQTVRNSHTRVKE